MDFVTKLSNTIVVDRPGLEALKLDVYTNALSEIYSHGMPVKIVDNATKFFSTRNLALSLEDEAQHDNLPLILEKRGIQLENAEIAIISMYHQLKKKILEPKVVEYQFAEVPADWSIKNNLTISSQSVYRNDNERYKIGIKTLNRIWKVAARYWTGLDNNSFVNSVQASGYTNDAAVYDTRIKIGCKEIQRFEIEQLALHLEWEFPKEG